MMYFKLAWRNLWRNRRRTVITMASIFFAVILSTLMMSLKEGIYVNLIDSMVGAYTGHAQIHANGYWDDKTLDESMPWTPELAEQLTSFDKLKSFTPRIES